MTAILTWLRLDLRRRWRSLAVLALLVAVATGTILASVAGARRGGTAYDRLAAATVPATVAVLPNQPGFDWNEVAALPEVAAMFRFPLSGFSIEGVPDADEAGTFPPLDDAATGGIERGVILAGRDADQSAVDEAVVTPGFLSSYGRRVGDTVVIRLATPEQIDAGVGYDTAAAGPRQPVRIVGVGRAPLFSDTPGLTGLLTPTAAFARKYWVNLVGTRDRVPINAMLRLHGGQADIPAFKAGLARVSGRSDIDVWDLKAKSASALRTIDFERSALLAFAGAVLAAATFLIGQSVSRYAAAAVADVQVLRALGLAPRQALAIGAAGTSAAGLAGVAAGVAAAVAASPLFPVGMAADIEPSPGVDADGAVLGTGAAVLAVLLVAGSAGAAGLALAGLRSGSGARRSVVAAVASRLGLPVPVVVGSRFALEPGRGRSAVPVRPALAGAVAGVLGVLAALTFQAGVADAADHPERFGQTYQVEGFTGYDGYGAPVAAVDELMRRIAAEPDVVAGVNSMVGAASIGVQSVAVFSYRQVAAPLSTVAETGRMPQSADEIALAPTTLERAGAQVGDTVRVVGRDGRARTLRVSGSVYVPSASHNEYFDGGWLTPAGYDALFVGTFKFRMAYLTIRDGADPAAVAARLDAVAAEAAGAGGEPAGQFTASPLPPVMAQLRLARQLPLLLGGFLALLAVGAVGHALATAVRRRRHDVAVLRALGLTRRQARLTVVVQASLLAVIGVLFGIPLGLALGRTVWRVVADSTPVFYVAPLAVLALALVAPVALLVANLLAAWPGHRAARLRIGHVLRAE